MATPVVLTTGARPITPVESGGVPMTPVDTLGEPVTVVDALGEPVVLINEDGTPAYLAYSAKTYLGGVAPYHWLDFVNNRALYAGADVGNVTQATGYSFTRASQGYYQNADGTLTLFGSGALRRGDRGVLIEGSRTNLLLQSQTFDNASWSKVAQGLGSTPVVTANAALAPDGTMTADQLDVASGGAGGADRSMLVQTVTIATGTVHAVTVFVRTVSGSANFKITLSGAVTTNTTTVLATTTWQRVVVLTSGGAETSIIVRIGQTGNENVTASYYLWGAQLEASSFASSYIPTTSASVTRASDVLTYTAGVSYPLSLWAEFERAVDTGDAENILRVNAGSGANEMGLYVSSADRGSGYAIAASVGQYDLQGASVLAAGVTHKTAARTDTNSGIVCTNGTLTAQDSSVTLPTNPTLILIGGPGYIRRAAIFNAALTNAQLQTVTT